MTVNIATPADAEDLLTLNTLFENDTTLELIRKSLAANDYEVVCIAFVDGIADGYACALVVKSMCYNTDRADIETLYVREEYRRQGVGEALMRRLEGALAERGIRHLHICVRSGNTAAQSLYKKLGYADTGEILMDKSV